MFGWSLAPKKVLSHAEQPWVPNLPTDSASPKKRRICQPGTSTNQFKMDGNGDFQPFPM